MKTVLVARSSAHARDLKRRGGACEDIAIFHPGNIQLAGMAPPKTILVCEGVDLETDVGGEGSLLSILKNRQLTWGDKATLIIL